MRDDPRRRPRARRRCACATTPSASTASTLDSLPVPAAELAAALEPIGPELRRALERRHGTGSPPSTRRSCRRPITATSDDGIVVTSYRRPVDRAGCYVPGGRAAYPSTVLMTAVPAQVAGVPEVVLCVPPDRSTGRSRPSRSPRPRSPASTRCTPSAAPRRSRAMAYGTESIRPVDVIVGPGNVYVALAKREVAGAGRRAVGVRRPVRGRRRRRRLGARRLRRHRRDRAGRARSRRPGLADHLGRGRGRRRRRRDRPGWSRRRPRRAEIESTFAEGGYAVLVDSPEQAIAVANPIAPEHLELLTADPEALVPARPPRRRRVLRPVVAGLGRRLRRRTEPRAAHLRHGPLRVARSPSTTS